MSQNHQPTKVNLPDGILAIIESSLHECEQLRYKYKLKEAVARRLIRDAISLMGLNPDSYYFDRELGAVVKISAVATTNNDQSENNPA